MFAITLQRKLMYLPLLSTHFITQFLYLLLKCKACMKINCMQYLSDAYVLAEAAGGGGGIIRSQHSSRKTDISNDLHTTYDGSSTDNPLIRSVSDVLEIALGGKSQKDHETRTINMESSFFRCCRTLSKFNCTVAARASSNRRASSALNFGFFDTRCCCNADQKVINRSAVCLSRSH